MKNFSKIINDKDIITKEYGENNSVQYTQAQSLTDAQKERARNNIGAGTSSFDGNYDNLSHKPTIPSKTSQLTNDSDFIKASQVEANYYKKPSTGIPKTDLASAVQTSLDYADNAVRYNANQSLTATQKEQARNNIGAGTSNFSGEYKDLLNPPTIPEAVQIVQTTGTSTTAVMSQKAVTDNLNTKLSKTDNTGIEVIGTKKNTTTLGGDQLYAPNGIVFGGTAAAAGLVTRGICGVTTPEAGGACSKENLYLNYDSNNDFNVNRQVVINAGTVGTHLGSNMYQYAVPRGEIVKNWVESKGYATTSQVNEKQNAITDSNKLSASLVSGLATVATSGSYNDLSNKPTIPTIPTNYVTTDTEQTVTGAKTFTSDVVITKSSPNLNMKMSELTNGTNPTSTSYDNLNFGDKNGVNLSVVRSQVISTGRTSTDLWTRSFGTNYGNYVGFFASPEAASAEAEGVWHFSPNLNAKHDLGNPNLKWRNGYITNLQLCKVINGGGGNSLIQQNSDTSGADIIVGSNNCNLKIQGKGERPTYRQGTGSYANLALQSDIPTFSFSNGVLTITT